MSHRTLFFFILFFFNTYPRSSRETRLRTKPRGETVVLLELARSARETDRDMKKTLRVCAKELRHFSVEARGGMQAPMSHFPARSGPAKLRRFSRGLFYPIQSVAVSESASFLRDGDRPDGAVLSGTIAGIGTYDGFNLMSYFWGRWISTGPRMRTG